MSDCNHCNGLSRSRLLHRAAAEAGRGLPAIEPGMPLPAGTGLSRRSFLTHGAGAMLAVYGASRLGLRAFEEGIAAAATAPPQPVLVSVFLEGGADVLSVLSPQGDPLYRKLRPHLALAGGTTFAEDDRLHWHPAAGGLATLYGEQKVTVMPAIGYTNADQSHFTSRHYWEVGATSTQLRTGWLGRYLDHAGTADNPLQGLSLDDNLAPALATAKLPVASVDGPDRYDFWSDFQGQDGKPGFTSPVTYPTTDDSFPRRLAGLAAMLGAGLPLRCIALSAPGHYDTHSDQAASLTSGLQLTSDSLLAFQRDLEARGLADRVLVHVWSEFGRRAQENGSGGTDHGAAGVGFLLGTRAKGTMVGEFPGLATGLDQNGNLTATSDFRAVYAALLEQWFGTDAGAVLPDIGSFARPALIK